MQHRLAMIELLQEEHFNKPMYPVRLQRPGDIHWVHIAAAQFRGYEFCCTSNRPFLPMEALDCEIVVTVARADMQRESEVILRCRVEVLRLVASGGDGYQVTCRVPDSARGLIAAAVPAGSAVN